MSGLEKIRPTLHGRAGRSLNKGNDDDHDEEKLNANNKTTFEKYISHAELFVINCKQKRLSNSSHCLRFNRPFPVFN